MALVLIVDDGRVVPLAANAAPVFGDVFVGAPLPTGLMQQLLKHAIDVGANVGRHDQFAAVLAQGFPLGVAEDALSRWVPLGDAKLRIPKNDRQRRLAEVRCAARFDKSQS